MELTEEQKAVISSSEDIKVNAVAGSGKTTTVIAYANARPQTAKILYLAFNKTVRLEAAQKFAQANIDNATVETAHSLAYKYVVAKSRYQINAQGYKNYDIAKILNIRAGRKDKHFAYILAHHINCFVAYFCNSTKSKISELDYRTVVPIGRSTDFVDKNYKQIELLTRIFLGKMDKAEIAITHDFYLKKFQLSSVQLRYDYILFDEGQDASPVMLDVFFKQKAVKVIVGDTHQQIYGWRYAVNSLSKANYSHYNLSASFRFGPEIASLASSVLTWKHHLPPKTMKHSVQISGCGGKTKNKLKAVIARTNLGLLVSAIEFVRQNESSKKLYFEGNFSSYTYADDGASLYDILNLYNGKRWLIKNTLIKEMRSMGDLAEYIDKTNDVQLGMMSDLVQDYGNSLPSILKEIKLRHLPHDNKSDADTIFSTVHRCKGMEYGEVQIAGDFMSEGELQNIIKKKEGEVDLAKLNEEINLLYVAITRAQHRLYCPENLLPEDYISSGSVQILRSGKRNKDLLNQSPKKIRATKSGSGSNAYQPWEQEDDEKLTDMCRNNKSTEEMAQVLGRSAGAIRSRIAKLELTELYG